MYYSKSLILAFVVQLWAIPALAEGEFERQRQQALTIKALTQQIEIAELKLKLKAANKKLMELEQGPTSESVSATEKHDAPPSASLLPGSLARPGNAAFPALSKSVFKRDARLIEIINDAALIEFDGRRYLVRSQDTLAGYKVSSIDKNTVRLTHTRTKKPLTLQFFDLSGVRNPQSNAVDNSVHLFSPLPESVPDPATIHHRQ